MGKIVEKKKKKGRPSLLDIQKRNLREQQQQNQPQTNPNLNSNPISTIPDPNRRFTRRNLQSDGITDPPASISAGEDDEFDEGDSNGNQRDKKFKFVLKLPPQKQNQSPNAFDPMEEGENSDTLIKKRKIDVIGARSAVEEDEKEESHNLTTKPTDAPSESSPAMPLPDRKLLVFILDRLQKKDTYGVYAEPVDPNELPDYHEIVEHPMDFGTVRIKLSSGAYASLEQFENDVFLICSNAMKYNAPDTIYFRQARSIQELAKKDFENLRQESDDNASALQPKRRGRPPKNLKKHLGRPPIDRTGSEFSSDATLANAGDNNIISNTYDLRRGQYSGNIGSADTSGRNYHGFRSEAFARSAENKSDVNGEFSASMMKGMSMKAGMKHFVLDENRRNTYLQPHPLASGQPQSVLTTFDGEKKQLMAVGLHMEHSFARSLARFAATLGPVAWKIASKRIERALPAGVKFGPGWVGENEAPFSQSSVPIPQQPSSPSRISSSKMQKPSNKSVSDVHFNRSSALVGNTSCDTTTERREITGRLKSESGDIKPNPPFQIHPGRVLTPMNGFIGSPIGDVLMPAASIQTNNEIQQPMSKKQIESEDTQLSGCSNTINSGSDEAQKAGPGTGIGQSSEHQKSDPVPPDLNVRFQSSPISPTSTQQPDLVLQL